MRVNSKPTADTIPQSVAQRVAQKKPREGAGLKLLYEGRRTLRKRGNPHRDNTTAG